MTESAGWVRGIGPVIASDKSYATIYSYGTGKVVTGIELPDTEGKPDDPKAGEFTYLCLTAPEEKKNDKGSYTTFNLINTADNYRATFDYNEGEGVRLPCTMIRQDTESEKLAGVLTDFFGDVGAK